MIVTDSFNKVWIELTPKCNNLCRWCYYEPELNSDKINLSFNQLLGALKLLKSLSVKTIILTGGEPTLYPKLDKLLKEIVRRNFVPLIISNGRKFKDLNLVKKLKACGLTRVTISLEGHNAKSHDAVTNISGSFIETVQGIVNLQKEGIMVSTNTTISSYNLDSLDKIIYFLLKHNIKNIGFNICTSCHKTNDSILVSPKKICNKIELLFSQFSQKDIFLNLVTPVPLCNFTIDFLRKNKDSFSGMCQIVHGKNFVINYKGDVLSCTHLINLPLFNILVKTGKILSKKDFIKKYNSMNVKAFRKSFLKYPSKKCCAKEFSFNCSGGCPLFWINFDPNLQIKG